MAVKNTAQVVIDGKIITLGGYESEEYFQKVAAYMNNKISELSQMPGYSRQAMETKHIILRQRSRRRFLNMICSRKTRRCMI